MDYASVAFGVEMEALEDSNMLVQLLGNQEHHNLEMPSFYMSHDDVVTSHYSSSDVNSSLNCWAVGGCVSGHDDLNLENYHLDYSNHGGFVMDLLVEDEKSDSQEPLIEVPDFLAPPKRRLAMSESRESLDECVQQTRRVSIDVHKNVTPKRKKSKRNAEIEEQNTPVHKQTSSSSSSEDESCESQEITCDGGTTHSPKGSTKSRAGRGTATDSQSLYARKRRERINQRLKILQNLVPNGTKVDISTMLEDAVQYVKFLQLQIKLLSSDDLWMYAPIASNGMTIGLDLKMSMPQ